MTEHAKQPRQPLFDSLVEKLAKISPEESWNISKFILALTQDKGTYMERWNMNNDYWLTPEKWPYKIQSQDAQDLVAMARELGKITNPTDEQRAVINNMQLAAILFGTQYAAPNKHQYGDPQLAQGISLILLRKVQQMTNPDAQMAALRTMRQTFRHNAPEQEQYKTILTMAANHPNASIEDKLDLMNYITREDEAQKTLSDLYNDIYALALKEFQTQSKSDTPIPETMTRARNQVKIALARLHNNEVISFGEHKRLEQDINTVFNVEQALVHGAEYVAQETENISIAKNRVEAENADLRRQLADAEQMRTEIELLRRQLVETHDKLDHTRAELTQTKTELTKTNKTLGLTRATLEARDKEVEEIQELADKAHIGVGSSGINKLKNKIKNAGR